MTDFRRIEAVMTIKSLLVVGGLSVLVAGPAWAQTPAAQPRPGPEHERLGFLIGKWKLEGEAKPPSGPDEKISGTVACEWFDGRFHVICRSDLPEAMKQLEIFGYSPKDGAYARYFINSNGQDGLDTNGKVTGKTWDWSGGEFKEDGKTIHPRAVVTEVSPDSWISKGSVSIDGGPPAPTYELRATRIK
jgi:hypothetical protein